MSTTFDLVCHTRKLKHWVGQRGTGVKKIQIYTVAEECDRHVDLFTKHVGHDVEFTDSEVIDCEEGYEDAYPEVYVDD